LQQWGKEKRDVPMWLEEGLCQLIRCEVNPVCRAEFDMGIACTTEWYALDEMWNDLSACEDVNRAYLQAYKEARDLVEKRGKADVIRSLYLNRVNHVSWNNLLDA
jgi:DNA phosphorothioation-dependent restriction protein DptG